MKCKKRIKIMSLLLATLTVFTTLQFTPISIGAVGSKAELIDWDTEAEDITDYASECTTGDLTETWSDINYETETWSYEYTEPLSADQMAVIGGSTAELMSVQITSSTIPDGVYALENVGNPGLWMDTQWARSDPGYHMQQYALTEDPTVAFTRSCLFKITQVPGTNRYVIRSMLNNRLSFNFSGTEVLTKEIPTKDSDVPQADTFTITYSINGYVIKPYGNSAYCVAANDTTASGAGGAPDSYLIKEKFLIAGNHGEWKFFQYTGEAKYGTTLTNVTAFSDGLSNNDGTVSIGVKTWSTIIGANTPKLSIDSSYSSIVSHSWNSSTYTLSVSAKKSGDFKIIASVLYENETTYRSVLRSYIVSPELYDKITFIENVSTGRFVDVEGPSKNSGAIIQQWQFNGKPQSKWTFEATSNGYFRIVSKYSGLYLGVDSTATTSVKQYATESDYTQWQLIETASGNYKFVCKATKSSGYVLSSASATSGNGSDLVMASYTNDSNYKDEWIVHTHSGFENFDMDIGDQRKADLRGVIDIYPSTFTDFTYTVMVGTDIVSVDNSTGTFTALKSGTARIRAIHKSTSEEFQFRIKVNKNAIIIVPGILGSELFVGGNNPYFAEHLPLFSSETINGLSTYQDGDSLQELISSAWGENLIDNITNVISIANLYNAWSESMSCNDNGSSKYNVYVKEYRSTDPATTTNNNCGTGDAYLELYNKLFSAYSSKYSIDLFSYDWRLSNAISASKLDDYIEHHNYDKVILIAHSMGGLVASGYLSIGETQRNKVDKLVYLNSPLLGTPTIVNVWFNEDISFIESNFNNIPNVNALMTVYEVCTTISDPLQNLICNYTSMYELFPSKYHFQLTNTPYISLTSSSESSYSVTEKTTYADTKALLPTILEGYDSSLAQIGEAFHNSTYIQGQHISTYVDAYYYDCIGENTISHLDYYEDYTDIYTCRLTVDSTSDNGDGLVLESSATLNAASPSKCRDFSGNHMSPIYNSTIIDSIINDINN